MYACVPAGPVEGAMVHRAHCHAHLPGQYHCHDVGTHSTSQHGTDKGKLVVWYPGYGTDKSKLVFGTLVVQIRVGWCSTQGTGQHGTDKGKLVFGTQDTGQHGTDRVSWCLVPRIQVNMVHRVSWCLVPRVLVNMV